MNYKEKILEKINNLNSNQVFIANDFFDIAGYENIRKVLNRLVTDGEISRIMNGIYYKPKYIDLIGEYEAPSVNEVANAIARKYNWTIAPSGNTALNLLGLGLLNLEPLCTIYYYRDAIQAFQDAIDKKVFLEIQKLS